MTEGDLEAIAEPLARIANRYQVARQLAGHSDEISVGVAVFPYVKRNLAARGRARTLDKIAERETPNASRYEPSPPASPVPTVVEESDEAAEDANVPAGDVFDGQPGPSSLIHLAPHDPGEPAA